MNRQKARILLSGLLASLLPAFSAAAAEPPCIVLKNGRILSISGGELSAIPRGTVVIRGKKITAVGPSIPLPEEATVIDLTGRWILPGFIDAHSQVGVRGESDEVTSAITEDLRLLDGFDPWDPEIKRHLERGVTSVALSPGDRNVVGGLVSWIKLVPGRIPVPLVDARIALKASLSRAVLGGPSFPRYPTAVSGALELFQEWLQGKAGEPARNGKGGGLPVLVRIENRSQGEQAIQLLKASNRPHILLAGRSIEAEALRLLAPNCPVILGPFDLADSSRILSGSAVLEEIGIPLAFGGGGERRDLLTTAVLAMRGGLSRAGALSALTDGPARILGLDGRLGSIVPQADADLVVWSGDPFTLSSKVELVLVNGEIVFRAPPQARNLEAPGSGAPGNRIDVSASRVASPEELSPMEEASPEAPAILIRAGRIHPVSAESFPDGQILVARGKIIQVGRNLTPPAGTEIVDVAGDVFPGLIEPCTSLGIPVRPAEEFRELTPEMRAVRGVDRDSRKLGEALRSGISALGITPGDRNVIGGLGAVIKTAPGRRAGDLVRSDAFLQASLTPSAASGNQSLRFGPPSSFYHRIPTTRMGTVFLLRRAFFEALDLRLPRGMSHPDGPDFSGESESSLARYLTSPGKAILAETLRGRRPLFLFAEKRQEIEAALRIADEFEEILTRLVLVGFSEGMELIPEIQARGYQVLLSPGGEVRGITGQETLRLAALLAGAGVEFAYVSERDEEVPLLRERLGFSLRFGLDADRMLRAATLGAARILGVEKRLGAIEPGKDADLVALQGGGPLDATAAIEWVMVDGRIYRVPHSSGRSETATW